MEFSIDIGIGSTGANPLSSVLSECKNVRGISLRGNNFKSDSLVTIINAIASNNEIKELDISHNKCNSNTLKVSKSICELMNEKSEIEELNIGGLYLGTDLGSIFPSLSSNTHVCISIFSYYFLNFLFLAP